MHIKKKCLFYSIHATQVVIFVLILSIVFAGLGVYGLTVSRAADAEEAGRLAIVIDDFGLQRKGVNEMLALECKLTVAVMPFLEYSEDDAENALENGKEVIIHIPMQATMHDQPSHLGPRPIWITNTAEEIQNWISDALCELPEAKGANIHMGTISSTKECVIGPVLSELKKKNLYFVDSKTSSKSVCREAAHEIGIAFYENEVFLEHERKTKEYVKKRLQKAMKTAKAEGSCIAIGHVGCEGGMITVNAIREMLPEFQKSNVELVFVSELAPISQ